MSVSNFDVSRPRLIRDGSFLENDWREIAQQRHAVDRIVPRYRGMGEVLLDPDIDDTDLRTRLFAVVSENELRGDHADLAHWTRGAREVYDQMNACSCLTLILACIIYWQAREISRIAAAPDFPFDPELIARVSPIEWKNVILYGEIKIDPDKLRIRGR